MSNFLLRICVYFYSIDYTVFVLFFFFQAEDGIRDGRVTGVQTCALPISLNGAPIPPDRDRYEHEQDSCDPGERLDHIRGDRKSTRLNSSHPSISYAVFCLKKKKKK